MAFRSCWAIADSTELGDVALHQALLDLNTGASLMCVAAHPDDEDGATLALYRKKYGVRTIAVIATRGEGGQNEIGPELYNDLGVIRTREMMRASKITGAELHFLNLPEFGFSKSPEETFAVWGREETVRRLVRAIRLTQPTAIVSNHGTQKDHGHHQAIGLALQEAFDAAGDAAKFPELEQEALKPWQPSRLYLRAWQPNPDALLVDINQLDPVRGKTYARIAADALGEHKSQGMGFFIDYYLSGTVKPAYILVKSKRTASFSSSGRAALFPDLDGKAMAGDTPHGVKRIDKLLASGRKQAPDGANARVAHWLESRWDRAVARALQIQLDATLAQETALPGQLVTITCDVSDFGGHEATSATVSLEPEPWFDAAMPEAARVDLTKDRAASTELSLTIPANAPLTVPEGERLFDPHFMEPQLTAVARVDVKGAKVPVELRVPLTLKIAPPVETTIVNSPMLVRCGTVHDAAFDVLVKNNAPEPSRGKAMLSMAPGFVLDQSSIEYDLPEGGQRIYSVHAKIGGNLEPRDYLINAVVEGDVRPSLGVARLVDVEIPEDANIGVVQSYDNTFMNVLEKLGIPHEALTVEDFTQSKLDSFSAIIIDIRAYLVRPDLAANNAALLDYIARGGTLIVNYQKTEEWKPEYAPFPIKLSRNRVTREDASVKLLIPDHSVFTTPNAIRPEDWDGWFQERGLYFPVEWDVAYMPLIECNDPGESNPPGALLIAKHGEGNYAYTALVLYRQIRELHPGALRLFANLLALGKPR